MYRSHSMLKSYFFSIIAIFVVGFGFSQEKLELNLVWLEPIKEQLEGIEIIMPHIEGQGSVGQGNNFHYIEEVPKGFNAQLELFDYTISDATKADISYLMSYSVDVPTIFEPDMIVTNGGGKRFIVVDFFPFVKINGQIKRIASVTIKKNKKSSAVSVEKDFVSESVLRPGSGDWYKISVNKDGVYKIDRALLASLGIDVESLNPQQINIYGNGEGRLPEANNKYRTDDLALNSIIINGETDGVFDEGDYILFYGWGPDRWYGSSTTGKFEQDKNIYSNFSYYYININPTNVPARIQNEIAPSGATTHPLTSYSYKDVHELDAVNIVSSGQRWYGELFDVQLNRNFSFNVPNIDPSFNSSFTSVMAAKKGPTGSSASISYSLNGTTLSTASLGVSTPDYSRTTTNMNFTSSNANLNLELTVSRSTAAIIAYLDRIVLNTRRSLVFTGSQFNFHDLPSVGAGNIGEFTISNMPLTDAFVWNVTDKHHPKKINGTYSGSNYTFKAALDTITEFVASNGLTFLAPLAIGKIENQDLHSLEFADNIIVTDPSFLSQANRLADLHRSAGMTVHVATTDQIYNEFSSGALDPTAIRMFVKMFYDRAAGDETKKPKYLTLFGDGTYDPKNRIGGNSNWIPTYQVVGGFNSESLINNIVTDDFYAFLDDTESFSGSNKVDVGVGRILVNDAQTAKEQVDKIEHYMKNGSTLFAANNVNCIDGVSTSTFGDWRTEIVNMADAEDAFFTNQEQVYSELETNNEEFNIDKLYLDAFPRTVTAGGYRYPQVVDAITNHFEQGALVMTYVGHGGEAGLAAQRIVTIPQIQALKNIDNLPLFVSATCEFTRFDDGSRLSAGEYMALNPIGGAIALLTTTRSVYYGVAFEILEKFSENAFVRNTDFSPRTFGQIVMNSKVSVTDANENKLALVLIGDPALTIAVPKYNMVIDSINGFAPGIVQDTIRALTKAKVKGHLEDFSGNILTSFNGVASPSLYDKPKQMVTLGEYNETSVQPFELQQNIIYRGKSTVTNGYFSFEFIAPKDIDYSYGNGKFSLYANNSSSDAIGVDTRVTVGGLNPNGLNDNVGPEITMFLNNENFVNTGITNETPILIAKIFDENGVNTVGNGIGHDITAILDGNTSDPIVLNSYYTANLDTYQSGEIRFQFNELAVGSHTLRLKIWDVNNNSSEQQIEFVVQKESEMTLEHVLNYPNPFTTNTEFFFEHNQCCTDLETQIQIFTVSGKLVKTINKNIYTSGYRSEGIAWDGKDDYGDQLAKGVYVYRLKVKTPEGLTSEKLEKLVLLR